jgi:hypothetical protein
VVFPQDIIAGLSARELENHPDRAAVLAELGAGWSQVGTFHHHCTSSAFMSGTDENDERRQNGLHVTVGRLNCKSADFHSRMTFRGVLYRNVVLEDWFEQRGPEQLSLVDLPEFPEVWKTRLIKAPPTVYRQTWGQSAARPWATLNGRWVQEDEDDWCNWTGNRTGYPYPVQRPPIKAPPPAAKQASLPNFPKPPTITAGDRKEAKAAAKRIRANTDFDKLCEVGVKELNNLTLPDLLAFKELMFMKYKEMALPNFKGGHTAELFCDNLLDPELEMDILEDNAFVCGSEAFQKGVEAFLDVVRDTPYRLSTVLTDLFQVVAILEKLDTTHRYLDKHPVAAQRAALRWVAANASALQKLASLSEGLKKAQEDRMIEAAVDAQEAFEVSQTAGTPPPPAPETAEVLTFPIPVVREQPLSTSVVAGATPAYQRALMEWCSLYSVDPDTFRSRPAVTRANGFDSDDDDDSGFGFVGPALPTLLNAGAGRVLDT